MAMIGTSLRRRSNALLPDTVDTSWRSSSSSSSLDEGVGSPYRKRSSLLSQKEVIPQKLLLLIMTLLAIAPWLYHSSLAFQMRSIHEDIQSMQMAQKKLKVDLTKAQVDYDKNKKQHDELHDENDRLLRELSVAGDDVDTESTAYKQAEGTEDKYFARIDYLEKTIQSRGRSTVVKKYGLNPVRVNVTLQEEPTVGLGRSFIIETAPIHNMPHSIDLFISLVESKFYQGLTFLRQAQGAPNLYTTEIDATTLQLVGHRKDTLKRLAFPERSSKYPTETYSVSFAGPGPNFYINMDRRKGKNDITNRDASFGKVVEGQTVVEGMVTTKVLQHIESMQILPPTDL